MIKKLRYKLVGVAMFSLFLVLTVMIGSVNILNFRSVVTEADGILQILEENNGKFPMPDEMHTLDREFKPMSPEKPYETRFYSVLLKAGGDVLSVDTGKIAAVDTSTAIEYAQKVFQSGKSRGFLKNYRYLRQADSGGNIRVIFVDCQRSLSTFRNFLFISCVVSLLGLTAVFLLLVWLSGRIIRPVSESYEKQKQFITNAGHELKTPLTIIDADAQVLEMDMGENEWLQDIQNQTSRLASLTNDLIYLSKMEEGGNQFHMLEFPISDVVSETAQSFQALARTQKKEFICTIQPMLSFTGDEKAIRRLVSILLDNALKYSQEKGRIQLSLEKQGRMIHLQVFNTTEAVMEQENLKHFFDRFYRGDLSHNSQVSGHGIGLSMARAIVAAHKGKITAASAESHSLAITAQLPVR